MWLKDSVIYQIYPLGFCKESSSEETGNLRKVIGWIDHYKKLGVNAILFNPIFESDVHGYDTRDYQVIDRRLGTNEDFRKVCKELHSNGIRVILDGVFNHVGRGFWAFQDVLKNREQSEYKDWFHINFGQDNGYQDGLSYEGWEGHYDLVKLNLKNPAVVEHLFQNIKKWVEEFEIDGLRLDVAYCLDTDFLKQIRQFCDTLKPDFALIGEILFGDYKRIVNDDMLQSCTNYECYKGIYSSCNDLNLFEISYSINRQFGENGHGIYEGLSMMNFVDNHDVSRLASILKEKQHLKVAYGIVYTMPGFPCLYYGSEWGAEGKKEDGDNALRPAFDAPEWNDLTTWIETLGKIRLESDAIKNGSYRNVTITNKQLVYERATDKEKVLVAMNLEDKPFEIDLKTGEIDAVDLVTNEKVKLTGKYEIPAYDFSIFQVK